MQHRILVLCSFARPEIPGFNDKLFAVEDNQIVYGCPASGCPNNKKPNKTLPFDQWPSWENYYAWIACTPVDKPLHWEICTTGKRPEGCFVLESGGAVPTRVPNPNQCNTMFAYNVEIHKADTDEWRGSAACITIQPKHWSKGFFNMFMLGEKGLLYIFDCSKISAIL
jgi:hypothetical protein